MTPIAKARARKMEVVIARTYHEKGGKMKQDGADGTQAKAAEKKRGPGLGSRAPKVALR
jgi:hypothetical protein